MDWSCSISASMNSASPRNWHCLFKSSASLVRPFSFASTSYSSTRRGCGVSKAYMRRNAATNSGSAPRPQLWFSQHTLFHVVEHASTTWAQLCTTQLEYTHEYTGHGMTTSSRRWWRTVVVGLYFCSSSFYPPVPTHLFLQYSHRIALPKGVPTLETLG